MKQRRPPLKSDDNKPGLASRPVPLPRSLLADAGFPEGFDEEGKQLLATTKKKEFTLYSLAPSIGGGTLVVRSTKVEVAYWKAIFRIKGSVSDVWAGKEVKQRVAWAKAVSNLVRFTQRQYEGGQVPLARSIGETFGREILKGLRSAKSGKSTPEDIANRITSMFGDAVLAQLRAAGTLRDRRLKTVVHPIVVLISEAEGYFAYRRETPTKSYLRRRMDQIGCGFIRDGKKSKSYAADWQERFKAAALETLPE